MKGQGRGPGNKNNGELQLTTPPSPFEPSPGDEAHQAVARSRALVDAVESFVRHEGLFSAGDRLIVGCSGGLDSCVLLDVLVQLSEPWRLSLVVAHVNYGLRSEDSDADEGWVRSVAEQHGLPCRVLKIQATDWEAGGQSSRQARARQLRRRFFEAMRQEHDAQAIALAHTRTDQAETVLLRLLRGTSVTGLSAMAPRTAQHVVRPLLMLDRPALEAFAHDRSLQWREDRSNATDVYTRNRVRHQLMPLMQTFNPRVQASLAQLAECARRDNAFLEACCDALLQQPEIQWRGDVVSLPTPFLLRQPEALQLRILAALEKGLRGAPGQGEGDETVGLTDHQLQYRHLLAGLALIRTGHGTRQLDWPGGIQFACDETNVWLRRGPVDTSRCPDSPANDPESDRCHWLNVPGVLTLQDGRVLRAEWGRITPTGLESPARGEPLSAGAASSEATAGSDVAAPFWQQVSAEECLLDPSGIQLPLQVRYPRPGDRFFPLGAPAFTSLKEFFIRQKVPREARATRPLILSGETVLWIVGLRRAEQAKVTWATDKVVRLSVTSHHPKP